MSIRNTTTDYGSVTRWFHWISALLIIGMLILGTTFTVFLTNKELISTLINLHKSFGLLIIILILLRWVWRRINPTPIILSKNKIEEKMINWYHELFYLVIFLMLLSGIFMSASKHYPLPFFGLFTIQTTGFPKSIGLHELCKSLHLIFAWTLAVMILVHTLGAFKHHIINKDATLRRMLGKS